MSAPDPLILANIIRTKCESASGLDVLTFVSVADDGSLTDRTRTYEELWNNGQRFAALLDELGMQQGQSFGLMMQNHPEFVDVMVGSSIANTIFVPIDPRTKGAKLVYMLTFAECRGIVVADYSLPALLDRDVASQLDHLEWILVVPTGPSALDLDADKRLKAYPTFMDRPVPDLPVRATRSTDPMQMLYTSGTTGDPKAILSPHARFGTIASIGPGIGLERDDRPYNGLSLTHANAQLITLGNVLAMGLRGVFSVKFTKSRLWDITRRYGCTMFNLLGGMTTAIYSEPIKPNDADHPVRYVLSAGMPKVIWENFRQRFGVEIFELYGTAEGGLTLNPPGGPVGSIGKAPPSMICSVRDEDDRECPPYVSGELCFKNADGSLPQLSYFKNQDATEKKLQGGWFRSGDIGHADEDGFLYFEYRKGTAIRRNGDFINPAFVEKAVAEHPSVDDVFVWGIATEANAPGEKEVVAAIVPRAPGEFDPQAVFDHCKEVLEANFIPAFIQVLAEIPKTASEKPQERFCFEAFKATRQSVHPRR
ncbi:MAG: AMP-binding protein [Pseudomonadota bacterium]